jgi:hypothetical protein
MHIGQLLEGSPSPKGLVPAARRENLVTKDVDGELLVYDRERDHLHQLNRVAAAVWRLCDGRRSLETLVLMAGAMIDVPLDERSVRIALTKLDDAALLETPLAPEIRLAGMDRRRFLKRSAIGAGALPVIVSMSAPTAAAAASAPCLLHGHECSPLIDNCCTNTVCRKGDLKFDPWICSK